MKKKKKSYNHFHETTPSKTPSKTLSSKVLVLRTKPKDLRLISFIRHDRHLAQKLQDE